MNRSIDTFSDKIQTAARWIEEAEAIVVGAGSGLSTSAGFQYSGERFERYMGDFGFRYGFHNMYEGGFFPFPDPETFWAYWSRYIYINRYMNPPVPVYENLLQLLKNRNYFVLTTNVDHMFQKAGFDKERLFYTQGDYGLFQQASGKISRTWDNRKEIQAMLEDQGFSFAPDGVLLAPSTPAMRISPDLVPKDPWNGGPVSPSLRADQTFVQDEGWDAAARRYEAFLRKNHNRRILFLELGVGWNTPGIIKYPFQKMAASLPEARLISIGLDPEPDSSAFPCLRFQADINAILSDLLRFLSFRKATPKTD